MVHGKLVVILSVGLISHASGARSRQDGERLANGHNEEALDAQEALNEGVPFDLSSSAATCGCWGPLGNPREDCCERTDRGTGIGDEPKCVPVAGVADCDSFCASAYFCAKVPHKFDGPGVTEWLGDKISEIGQMGTADLLLGSVARQVYLGDYIVKEKTIPVKNIKSIHPVGEWRENTWQKTLRRKQAVLDGKEILKANDYVLTTDLIFEHKVFEPLQSIGAFIAVPFGFHGYQYVTLEGNGRLKGIALAAAEDPDLKKLKVQVNLYKHKHDSIRRDIRASILKLWAQYVTEAQEFPEGDVDQYKAYMDFRLAVVKCRGFATSWWSAKVVNQTCPIVDKLGADPSDPDHLIMSAKSWSMWGVDYASVIQNMQTLRFQKTHADGRRLTYYKLEKKVNGKVAYLVGNSGGEAVKEYCPKCIDYVATNI